MNNINEVINRWDTFLSKIKERAEQIFSEAEDGCQLLLDLNNLDTIPMANAWMGINGQIHEITQKIGNTWQDKVEEAFELTGMERLEIYKQHDKGENLRKWLDTEKERREIKIFAEAAKKIINEAQNILKKDFKCTQCSAILEIPNKIFKSSYVTCEYCNAVTTFEPGTIVRSIEWFCAHNLAREKSWDEWCKLQEIEATVRQTRNQTIKQLKEYENTYREYYTKYLQSYSEIVPDTTKNFEKDLAGKMGHFYMQMKYNEVWNSHTL